MSQNAREILKQTSRYPRLLIRLIAEVFGQKSQNNLVRKWNMCEHDLESPIIFDSH